MKLTSRPALVIALVVGLVVGMFGARIGFSSGSGGNLAAAADTRGLTGEQAEAALATYVPPGSHDDYYLVASGGHSGQIHIIGVPSMQLLKTVPVFSPDSWSGYGFGADWADEVRGTHGENPVTWGDSHHPALSETEGDYDGRWVYINDRANGRLGMVDLRDFKTKQILEIPNIQTSHGGVFATPNTEYVHISSMTPQPLWGDEDGFAPLEDYADAYRGVSTFVAIDPETGKGDMERSFQIELPPYDQDLADAGKLASDGYAFINSYNTEMAYGDGTPKETDSIANDFDYMHVINWEKAAEVVADGKFEMVGGARMIRLETAVDEEILHFVEEPRNPHGVDVSPDGNYLVVAGKLDPTASVYDIELIKQAIAEENFSGHDPFGVPILDLDSVRTAQVELGGGPLHSQFDDKGNVYTSLFVESAVAKWTLGEKAGVDADKAWQLVDKTPIHYNVGHLVTAHGDTVAPRGEYGVSLNKWSVDRFPKVGTLLPQNFQLLDIEAETPKVIKDMPIGFGEPHYVQMVSADLFEDSWQTYPEGTDPLTMQTSEHAIGPGEESIERDGDTVTVHMSAQRSHFTPDVIRAKKGDKVVIHLTNIETAVDATHGFAIPGYDKQVSIDPGEVVKIELTADQTGSFAFYCTEFCSALHLEMQGWLLVEPA